MLLTLTNQGVACVPRASLLAIAATLSQFSLPGEALLPILRIDSLLDMGRSATNAIANSLATAVVARCDRAPRAGMGGPAASSAIACRSSHTRSPGAGMTPRLPASRHRVSAA